MLKLTSQVTSPFPSRAATDNPKITIKDLLAGLVAKIGENIVIRRFTRYQLGEQS